MKTTAALALLLLSSLSCSHRNGGTRILRALDRNEQELLGFQIPSQEYTVHGAFQKYKPLKLALVRKYLTNRNYRDELAGIGALRCSLDAKVVDSYSANVEVFNEQIIEAILGEPKDANFLKTEDLEFLKKIRWDEEQVPCR